MGDDCRVRGSQELLHNERRVSRSVVSFGTNFAAMHRMLSSPDKIPWHVPYDSRTMLQTSWFFQDILSHFCHILSRGSCRRSSRTLFIIDWHPSVLETLKPFVGLRAAYGIVRKCFFKHSVCFRRCVAEFEAEFHANRLLIHICHFSRSVRSQNSTNTTSQKCTEEILTSSQQNAA